MPIRKNFLYTAVATALFAHVTLPVHAQTHYKSSLPSVSAIDGQGGPVGGFGRLFPLYDGVINQNNATTDENGVVHYLLEHPSHRIELLRLAEEMIEENEDAIEGEMPLAHVFFGQFIDHDITLDTVSSFDDLAGNVSNARTPDLDLDCIYGDGREASPYLYTGPYLRVGAITVDAGHRLFNRYDLLRIPEPHADQVSSVEVGKVDTVAVIGDPRNDENFAVAQMQAAFIAYHNRMVDRIIERELSEEQKKSELVSVPIPAAQRLLSDGLEGRIAVDEVLKGVTNLREFSQSSRIASQRSSEFLKNQSQRVQSIQDYAALNLDKVSEEALQEFSSFVSFTVQQNEQDLSGLRNTLLNDPHFVEQTFGEARDLTIHHYHRVIMEDFLPRIISGKRVIDMMAKGRNFYFPTGFNPSGEAPYIPIEFSVAAYRFAHSQVPGRFDIRDGVGSALFRGADGNQAGDLLPRGFTPIRSALISEGSGSSTNSLVIDWSKLIDLSGSDHAKALKIDTLLSSPLETLDIPSVTPAGAMNNLAARNLSRGRTYRLPSGQDLARIIIKRLAEQGSLGAYSATSLNEVFVIDPDKATSEALITSETPLWYYIIQEASCFKEEGEDNGGVPMVVKYQESCSDGGNVLGPVGGTIVGEVLWGLVDHYRVNTGSGIDLNVGLEYCIAESAGCALAARNTELTKLKLTETIDDGSRRYLLKNLLHDAGVAYKIDETVKVCEVPAYLPSASCPPQMAQ